MTVNTDAVIEAIKQEFPGFAYILILNSPDTTDVTQVSNLPPEYQKQALEHCVKAMERVTFEVIHESKSPKH